MNVLFVCTGNTCRSVLAEHLLRKAARERGLEWDVRSCGVAADPGFPIPAPVRKLLAERGIELHHQPRALSAELVETSDVILAMTAQHLAAIRASFPASRAKTSLLRSYAGLDGADVADPIGMPEKEYRKTAAELEDALERILDREAPGKGRKTRGATRGR